MKKRGLTSAELSKRADVKTSFLYDIISGKSANPSTVKLARVADVLGINLAYLVGGPHRLEPETGYAGRRSSHDDYVSIPRITVDASAGGSMVAEEEQSEHYHFRKTWIKEHLNTSPANLRMLYVRGDSMEPTLCHNDMVLVDVSKRTASPPGVFVLFDGFGLVAKRLEFLEHNSKRQLRIMSDNAQYSTYERSVEETVIIGRVVWFAREI